MDDEIILVEQEPQLPVQHKFTRWMIGALAGYIVTEIVEHIYTKVYLAKKLEASRDDD